MLFPESLKLVTDTLWRIKKEDLDWSLEDLFTPSEIIEIADRILILKALKEGKKQRAIAEELWLSVTTVSKGSRVLKYGRRKIEKVL